MIIITSLCFFACLNWINSLDELKDTKDDVRERIYQFIDHTIRESKSTIKDLILNINNNYATADIYILFKDDIRADQKVYFTYIKNLKHNDFDENEEVCVNLLNVHSSLEKLENLPNFSKEEALQSVQGFSDSLKSLKKTLEEFYKKHHAKFDF
uniref:Uncharacterized protein n=1 Tax=Clastoptera arizonana TaxID=38151 RepID=A0A1B6CJI0_9HEMI